MYSRMIWPRPRNCSGVRSPRVILTSTVLKPSWRCGRTLASRKRSNSRAVAVRARGRDRRLGGVGLLVDRRRRGGRSRSRARDPVALELLVDHLAEGVDADLVDQHLDPGAGAVDAQPLLAVEDAEDGLGDLQVVAVVELDEVVERRGDAGHDRGAAADPDLDAADAVALARDEADVVDAGDRDVLVGRRERRLDLARHQLRRRVAHEVAHVRGRVRGDVEELALGDAGPRVAGDVADRVAAALARGEPASEISRISFASVAAAGCGGSGCSGGW